MERAKGAYEESKKVFYSTLSQLGGELYCLGVTHFSSIVRSPLVEDQQPTDSPVYPQMYTSLIDLACL